MQERPQACVMGRSVTSPARLRRLTCLAAPLLVALALPGCGALSGAGGSQAAAASIAVPQRPMEPLAIFASRAREGEQSVLAPAPGAVPVRVQVVRSYHAASGRPCRELAVGSGGTTRPALYCEEPGGWAAARPLLRGGAVARP